MRRHHTRQAVRPVRPVALAVVLALSLSLAPATTAPAGADANEAPGAPATYRALTAGNEHTCAILDDGRVKCWGRNAQGMLGIGDTQSRGTQPGEMGDDLPAVDLGTGRTATALSAGASHTCAMLDNGNVKCWGFGGQGRLGLGDTQDRGDAPGEMGNALPPVALGAGRTATALTAGEAHTCAILDNGSVKCWGWNGLGSGALGLGDHEDRGDDPGEMGDNLAPVALGSGRTATAISANGLQTCAILDNGSVKCWGDNFFGQLGLGDTTNRGEAPGQMGDALPAVQLGSGRTATAIAVGGGHTCALLDNARVKCWGRNTAGQLGLEIPSFTVKGDAPGEMGDALAFVDLGAGRTVTGLSTDASFTCARLDDGTVKCWGANGSGQLGLGDTGGRGADLPPDTMGDDLPLVALGTGRTAQAVTTGDFHACALLDDDTMRCWGRAVQGQLGQGVSAAGVNVGDTPDEMGDALPVTLLTGASETTFGVDAELRRSTVATYVGDGVHNTTGAGQTVAVSARRRQTVTFVVRIRNEGNVPDSVSVAGQGSSPGFTVKYLEGTANVTFPVRQGRFFLIDLEPNETRMLKVKVTVGANAPFRAVKKAKVTVTSGSDASVRDAVKPKVTVVR